MERDHGSCSEYEEAGLVRTRVLHLVAHGLLPPDMWRLSKVFVYNHGPEIVGPSDDSLGQRIVGWRFTGDGKATGYVLDDDGSLMPVPDNWFVLRWA